MLIDIASLAWLRSIDIASLELLLDVVVFVTLPLRSLPIVLGPILISMSSSSDVDDEYVEIEIYHAVLVPLVHSYGAWSCASLMKR